MTTHSTFAELAADHVHTVYEDTTVGGVHYLIKRGPVSLCAYLGVPVGHPLAGKDYDDVALEVHGGLTFCTFGDDKGWPAGWYWYGWDYAHAGDRCFYDLYRGRPHEHEWLVDEVRREVLEAIGPFRALMSAARTGGA